MYAFTFERPTSLADASKLASAGGKLLAGGQTLLASMKLRLANPDQLVDLGGVRELSGIRPPTSATGRCGRWAPWAARWPTTIRRRAIRPRCWH
jgi:CO/xanthine dehydrogenase FAD-binding subunit